MKMNMNIEVNGQTFMATVKNSTITEAFTEMIKAKPVTVNMESTSDVEKKGVIEGIVQRKNQKKEFQSGNIVLYNNSGIVVFYEGETVNSTAIGKIEQLAGWKNALSDGNCAVTFSA